MTDLEIKLKAHLQSLAEASRIYWSDGKKYGFSECQAEDHFETELVRAEDFLQEVVDADL